MGSAEVKIMNLTAQKKTAKGRGFRREPERVYVLQT